MNTAAIYSGDGSAFALFCYCCYAIGVGIVRYWLRQQPVRAPTFVTANGLRVSILKPLAGLDEELETNLESFATLDYPNYELLCCARDPQDPALDVARRVQQRHPNCVMKVLRHDGDALSPKVLNFEGMLPHATGELLMMSDSNVRVNRDDLRNLVACFDRPEVGLVYQPVVGEGEQAAAAAIENLRWGESAILVIAAKAFFNANIVNAKGILCRREALAAVGDFARVRDVHHDDHLLAMHIQRAGWQLRLAPWPARIIHRRWSLTAMIRRQLRQAAGRWRICPWAYPAELWMNPVVMALLPLLVGGWWGVGLFAGIVLGKTTLELNTLCRLRGRPMAWKYVPLVPLKDLLMFGIWIAALFIHRIEWRGKTYRMGRGTRMIPVLEHR